MNDMDRESSTQMHPTPPSSYAKKESGSGIVVPCPPHLNSSSVADDILTVKHRVYRILEKHPATRDSDKLLIMRFLVETKVGYYVKNGLFIPYSHFDDLPSFESIRRVRQKFQEQGLFPSSEKVQGMRELSRCEMHELMQGSLEVPVVQRRLDL